MKKITMIIASCMIVFGLLIALTGYFSGAKLTIISNENGLTIYDPKDRVSESFPLSAFTKIQGNIKNADVEIIPSNEFKIEIERYNDNKITHEVKDGTLYVNDPGTPIDFTINLNLSLNYSNIYQTSIKLYVPKEVNFTNITLKNDYGDVTIHEVRSDQLEIDINDGDLALNSAQTNTLKLVNLYGDVQLKNINSKELAIDMNNGDIDLKNVKSNTLNLINQYGDVNGNTLVFDKLYIDITDGDTDLRNITSTSFTLNNQYGDVQLNQLVTKGLNVLCNSGNIIVDGKLLGNSKITAQYGDVDLLLKNEQTDLNYSIINKYGDISVGDNQYEGTAVQNNQSKNKLDILANDGDINLQF